jgi:class 3 adenylate cyclase
MAELPAGMVTFLFTDVEGATRLVDQPPEVAGEALARHETLLRQAIEGHAGHVFQTAGDTLFAVFATAADGLAAALEAQRALQPQPWGETGPLKVRMALHTDAAEPRGGVYVGGHVIRAAVHRDPVLTAIDQADGPTRAWLAQSQHSRHEVQSGVGRASSPEHVAS